MHTSGSLATTSRRNRAEYSARAPARTKKYKNIITKMDNADLYHKSNSLQKRDALESLEEYAVKIKWKRYGARILDIGSGDGSVTTGILKKYIPENYKVIVGCDISPNMVQFANENHGDDRTHFILTDIESYPPKELMGSFDHAVSFYALHWIQHQKLAFMNMYDLMAEGGSCFLVFIGRHPVFEVFRVLARTSKWAPWLGDLDGFISPYHDSQDPAKEITQMMEQIGFRNIDVKCKEKSFIYDSTEDTKNAVRAINPFKIPYDLYDDFLKEYMDVVGRMRMLDQANNNQSSVKYQYNLIIAHATK